MARRAADLAIILDEEMLGQHNAAIAAPWTPDDQLPECTSLASELGDRYLVKYLRRGDHTRYSVRSGISYFPGVHFVTPTPLARSQLIPVLNLPSDLPAPRYALLLDPAHVTARGPRRIRGGHGVEYVLFSGFPSTAIAAPGWPITID